MIELRRIMVSPFCEGSATDKSMIVQMSQSLASKRASSHPSSQCIENILFSVESRCVAAWQFWDISLSHYLEGKRAFGGLSYGNKKATNILWRVNIKFEAM